MRKLVVRAVLGQKNRPLEPEHHLGGRHERRLRFERLVRVLNEGDPQQRARSDPQRECASGTRRVDDVDASAKEPRERPTDGEAQPRPSVLSRRRCVRLLERPEQSSALLVREADPAVLDGEVGEERRQAVRAEAAHEDANVPLFGELDRVSNQVQQDLPYARGVALYRAPGSRSRTRPENLELLLRCARAHERRDLGDDARGRALRSTSTVILPASIFERSRISLRTCSTSAPNSGG